MAFFETTKKKMICTKKKFEKWQQKYMWFFRLSKGVREIGRVFVCMTCVRRIFRRKLVIRCCCALGYAHCAPAQKKNYVFLQLRLWTKTMQWWMMKVRRLNRTLSVSDGRQQNNRDFMFEFDSDQPNNNNKIVLTSTAQMPSPCSENYNKTTFPSLPSSLQNRALLPLPKLGLSSPWFSAGKIDLKLPSWSNHFMPFDGEKIPTL